MQEMAGIAYIRGSRRLLGQKIPLGQKLPEGGFGGLDELSVVQAPAGEFLYFPGKPGDGAG
jgi:hypothetical protein